MYFTVRLLPFGAATIQSYHDEIYATIVWCVFFFLSARGLYEAVPYYGATGVVHRPFEEGVHYVEYKVVDDAGNFARCSFYVTVKGKPEKLKQ